MENRNTRFPEDLVNVRVQANTSYQIKRVIELAKVEELEEHIHQFEHVLYPRTIQMLAEGRVRVRENGTVEVA